MRRQIIEIRQLKRFTHLADLHKSLMWMLMVITNKTKMTKE
jgi:hypothetical protein